MITDNVALFRLEKIVTSFPYRMVLIRKFFCYLLLITPVCGVFFFFVVVENIITFPVRNIGGGERGTVQFATFILLVLSRAKSF